MQQSRPEGREQPVTGRIVFRRGANDLFWSLTRTDSAVRFSRGTTTAKTTVFREKVAKQGKFEYTVIAGLSHDRITAIFGVRCNNRSHLGVNAAVLDQARFTKRLDKTSTRVDGTNDTLIGEGELE